VIELTAEMLRTAGEAALVYPPGHGNDWGVYASGRRCTRSHWIINRLRARTPGAVG
jgi:hypothetical protein